MIKLTTGNRVYTAAGIQLSGIPEGIIFRLISPVTVRDTRWQQCKNLLRHIFGG